MFDYKKPYDFSNFPFNEDTYLPGKSSIKSLIHTINFLGEDIIGVELGVFEGESFMTLLHNCPNIKMLYGIDSYLPYADYLKMPYDGTPHMIMGEKDIDLVKSVCYNRIKYSGMDDKITFYEEDSNICSKKFEKESLDFIFIDTYMTYQQAKNDLEIWYPKLKNGGLFAGHDWDSDQIQNAVNEFRDENMIDNFMSIYDYCWCWIK
jgi:hypothetical protein